MYWLLLNQPPKLKESTCRNRCRVLIVEDNPADAELLLRELRRTGFEPEWKRVETEPDFLAGIARAAGHHSLGLFDAAIQRAAGGGTIARERSEHPVHPHLRHRRRGRRRRGHEARRDRLSCSRTGSPGWEPRSNRRWSKSGCARSGSRPIGNPRPNCDELQRWHEAMLGREDRILELKYEVNELLAARSASRHAIPRRDPVNR